MLLILKVLLVCFCASEALGKRRDAKHTIAKRWAYIENGDPQMRSIHTDCKEIVREYSDGELPFYEYTAKMKQCLNREQRTNIPSYEDTDFFTPTFNVPNPASTKRFETPNTQQQQQQQQPQTVSNQYGGNYGYDNTYQNQNSYGTMNQRGSIAAPQTPQYETAQAQTPQYNAPQVQTPQFGAPQAQAFPASNVNSYQQNTAEQTQPDNGLTARNNLPSNEAPVNGLRPLYSDEIVKKDFIPRPDVPY